MSIRAEAASDRSGRRRAGWALAALWSVYAAPALLSSGLPFARDTAITYFPLRTWFAERLHRSELPAWFPNEGLGVPYIGQIVTATFHPQSLLYLFLPAAVALKWTLYLAILGALTGAYRFARGFGASRNASVGAAAGYAFSGYVVSMTDNVPYLMGVATMPWVAWAGLAVARRPDGRQVAQLAALWALVFLGGDAQACLLAPLTLMACWVAASGKPRALFGLLTAGAVALLLVAIELGPALAVGEGSERSGWHGVAGVASRWALHPWRIPELVAPVTMNGALHHAFALALTGEPREGWARSLFCGAIILLASVVALVGSEPQRRRGVAAFGLLAGLALWLAFGSHAGLLPLALKVAPPLELFRYPEKYLALFALSLVPLAASGFDAMRRVPRQAAVIALSLGAAALLAALVVSGGASTALADIYAVTPGTEQVTRLTERWALGFARTGATLIVVAVALGNAARRDLRWARVVPSFAAIELLVTVVGTPALLPAALFSERNPLAEKIRESTEPPWPVARLAVAAVPSRLPPGAPGEAEDIPRADQRLMRPSLGALFGVDSFGVNLPGVQQRYEAVLGGGAASAAIEGPRFNGCYALVNSDALPPGGGTRVAEDSEYEVVLYRVPCAARAFIGKAVSAPDESSALRRLGAGLGLSEFVWEGGPDSTAHGLVAPLEWSPEHVRLKALAEGPAALFVGDAYAPGWQATVDGIPVPIHPADGTARGVEVPPGEHQVVMTYTVPNLRAGAGLSLLGLLIAAALATRSSNRGLVSRTNLPDSEARDPT